MQKKQASAQSLSDEDVLKEFIKRFQCDGAVLIYFEASSEYGFGRWRNSAGRQWVRDVFKAVKQNVQLNEPNIDKRNYYNSHSLKS